MKVCTMNIIESWGARSPHGLSAICLGAIRYGIARGAMRKPLRHILRGISPCYDVELDGLRMRCYVGDNTTETMALERSAKKKRESIDCIVGGRAPGDSGTQHHDIRF